ncbi:MAG TPA: hypothetical protein P5291_05190, partial [Flavobacteriales bacterium]|nr:hypothetical protein [Flavobacteriales bacterium]
MLMNTGRKPQATGFRLVACGLWLATCVASAQDSLNVAKIYQWDDPGLPGSFLYDNTYSAVWGYARDGR